MKNLEVRAWTLRRLLPFALAMAVTAGLTACGGGGGDSGSSGAPSTAAPSTLSSGVITAFGSVFVNGHRFHTGGARVIDDDTGAVTTGATGLEVGMVVDVRHRGRGGDDEAQADELHVHPLVRGFVDAADTAAGTLTVMGQKVQLTSGTHFSDRRACVAATTSPCTPITTADGLAATTVAGTTTATVTTGNYVTVHGFLFDGSGTDVVATLVSVGDVPAGNSPAKFKVEGVVTVTPTAVTIGSLTLDLSKANCRAGGSQASCATAFTTGEVVSAGSALAPASPATLLVADFARRAGKLPVETPGATVELEGVVSSVPGTATFVVRGITVDASGLPAGTVLPQAGDEVRVIGTLSATGDTVTATRLSTEDRADDAKLALKGQVTSVTPGAITGTFTISVLNQTVTVTTKTRLKDVSIKGWESRDPTATPFNITTFDAYLAASASRHVLVIAEVGSSGALVAKSLTLLPASDVAAIAGTVDATPAPVNSTVTGTATVFFVRGVKISADPAAITSPGGTGTQPATIAAGEQVVVVGTLTGDTIVVGPSPTGNNRVLDLGLLRGDDDDGDDNSGRRSRNRGMF
jgi:hypothetical protein